MYRLGGKGEFFSYLAPTIRTMTHFRDYANKTEGSYCYRAELPAREIRATPYMWGVILGRKKTALGSDFFFALVPIQT